ncbi:MAG: c-type cytochrome, partial [Chitinophagaceae bacterium]
MKQFLSILFLYTVLSCTNNSEKVNTEETEAGSVFGAVEKLPKEILVTGENVFTNTCQLCHNDTSKVGAPSMGVLAQMSPRAIVAALRTGKMKTNAEKLSLAECESVAQWITKKLLKETIIPQEAYTEFSLPANASLNKWVSGWGGNLASTGFSSSDDAGIHPGNVQSLQLKWAFAFPDASQARCRPAIIGDWLITGSQMGDVFAIHKKTGKIGWRFIADAAIRGGIQVDKAGDSLKVFFADYTTNVYALDLRTGKLIWKMRSGPESQS